MHLRDTILALCLSGGLLTYSAGLVQAAAKPDDETITYWIRQTLKVVNRIMVNWGYDNVALQRRLEARLSANAETH